MKRFYLITAILGAVIPYFFFIQHFVTDGVSLGGFVGGVFATPAASGFAADLLITSFVFWVVMYVRQRQGKGPNPILFIVVNLFIGLSCALPAYLYVITPADA
jgi:hypothetical protein